MSTLAEHANKDEVAAALAEGDDELQDEIDAVLEDFQKEVQEAAGEAQYDEFEPWWESCKEDYHLEQIVATIVANNSTGELPHEKIKQWVSDYLPESKGNKPWEIADRHHDTFVSESNRTYHSRSGYSEVTRIDQELSFTVEISEEMRKIPDDIATHAWAETGHEWSERTDGFFNDYNYARLEGEDLKIYVDDAKLEEALNDMKQEWASERVAKDPEAALQGILALLRAGARRDNGMTLPEAKELADRAEKQWKWCKPILGDAHRDADDAGQERSEAFDNFTNLMALWYSGEEQDALLLLREVCDYFVTPGDAEVVGEIKFKGEVGQTPWTVYNLKPQDLARESARMNHCVGKPQFGYGKMVKEGKIFIWSVRLPSGKPVFTIEIESNWQDWLEDDSQLIDYTVGGRRTVAGAFIPADSSPVKQVKGATNREPGFARARTFDKLVAPQEVKRLAKFFYSLGLDPLLIEDMKAGLDYLVDSESGMYDPDKRDETLRENPQPYRSFDMPYQPLELHEEDDEEEYEYEYEDTLENPSLLKTAVLQSTNRAKRRKRIKYPRKTIVQRGDVFIRLREDTDMGERKHGQEWIETLLDEQFPQERLDRFITYIGEMKANLPTKTTCAVEAQWSVDSTSCIECYVTGQTGVGDKKRPLGFSVFTGEDDLPRLGKYALMAARSEKAVIAADADPRWVRATDAETVFSGLGVQPTHGKFAYFKYVGAVAPWDQEFSERGLSPDDHEEMLAALDEHRHNPGEPCHECTRTNPTDLSEVGDDELTEMLVQALTERAELARVDFPYDNKAEIGEIREEMMRRGYMVYPETRRNGDEEEEKKPTLKCLWIGGPPGQTFLKIKKKLLTINIEIVKQSWDSPAVVSMKNYDLVIINQDMVGHPEYQATKAAAKAVNLPIVMGSLSFTKTYVQLQKAGFVR